MGAPFLFLSHAGEDSERAQELARHLRDGGLRVWLDIDELRPGDLWMQLIEQALSQVDAFAVYVGHLGVQHWVDRELRLALSRNAEDSQFRIIPLLSNGSDPKALPLFLQQHHYLQLPEIGDLASATSVFCGDRPLLHDRPRLGAGLWAPMGEQSHYPST